MNGYAESLKSQMKEMKRLKIHHSPIPIIIILNGPTSSGKSLISHFFQEWVETPFLHIGIDKMIDLMPDRMNNWEGLPVEHGFWWKEQRDDEGHALSVIQMGDYAKKLNSTYKKVVQTLASAGHHIIVDEVAFGKAALDEWREILKHFAVYTIGVFTDLDILEQREQARQDRKIGSARHQFYHVHQNAKYDFSIDTSHQKPEQSVLEIVNFLNKHLGK